MVTDKRVFNALGGLVRRGRLHRERYGRYRPPDIAEAAGVKVIKPLEAYPS